MISELNITQSNIEGVVNVMAVHNDLVFLIDATYSGDIPTSIYCSVKVDGVERLLARCLYKKDISENVRQFIFVADEILRGMMPDYSDFTQGAGTFVEVTNISQVFSLTFQSDIEGTVSEGIEIEACHAARNIGEKANMIDLCANGDDAYIGAFGLPVYVYFYNSESEPPSNKNYFIESTGVYFVVNGERAIEI